jgi:hypothetical protein
VHEVLARYLLDRMIAPVLRPEGVSSYVMIPTPS